MDSKKIARLALAGAVSLSALTATEALANTPNDNVKCYGVAAASKNDCGTVVSACAASIAQPGACYAWIYLPKGVCEKIVGASIGKPADTCKSPGGQPVPAPASSQKTTIEKNV